MNLQSNHPSSTQLDVILAAWIAIVAGFVVIGWLFSMLGHLSWVGLPDLIWGVGCVGFAVRQARRLPANEAQEVVSVLRFPPFLIILALIVFAIILYPPITHDSLSYRIPRIFFWLQDGHIGYVPASDSRINYMTHNWELTALPLLLLGKLTLLELPSLISWVLLYLVFQQWAVILGARGTSAYWLGLMPALATACVLQAASTMNDLFAAVFVLLSAWFITRYEKIRFPRFMVLSAFALTLAAGTKPHYAVFAAPWILWLLLSPSRPWRAIPWKLAWLLPAVLVVSPLPAFLINHAQTGSWMGDMSAGSDSFVGGNPFWNVFLGLIVIGWQAVQLPLNIFARKWNAFAEGLPFMADATARVPKFNLYTVEVPMVDGSSVGFLVALAACAGIVAYLWFWKKMPRWPLWLALASLGGLVLVLSQVVPATAGRSYIGFLLPLMALAMAGGAALPAKAVTWAGYLCFLAAAFTVIVSPSHPLWPAKTVLQKLQKKDRASRAVEALQKYCALQERFVAGKDLLQGVNAKNLLIIAGGGEPLVQPWLARPQGGRITLLPSGATAREAINLHSDYILITGTGPEIHRETIINLQLLKNLRFVAGKNYVVRLQRGPEKWELYQVTPHARPNP